MEGRAGVTRSGRGPGAGRGTCWSSVEGSPAPASCARRYATASGRCWSSSATSPGHVQPLLEAGARRAALPQGGEAPAHPRLRHRTRATGRRSPRPRGPAGIPARDLRGRASRLPDLSGRPQPRPSPGRRRAHQHYEPEDFRMLAPHIAQRGLKAGSGTATPRPTMPGWCCGCSPRPSPPGQREARGGGEPALRENGAVTGVRLVDRERQRSGKVRATVVVNATGAWADRLRQSWARHAASARCGEVT